MSQTLLDKQYSYVRHLGSGGNSKVFLVRDNIGGELRACKRIPKDTGHKKTKVVDKIKTTHHDEEVRREIRMMKRLQGVSGVTQIHEHFEDDMFFYILMQPCLGGTICEYMEVSQETREQSVKLVVAEALRILQRVHDTDIIHTDVKPENFLLDDVERADSLTLLDFGTAVDSRDPEVGDMFTPLYMPIESLSSVICKKSDACQVGVMTHYLLTDHFPFTDRVHPFHPNIYKIWYSIQHDDVDFDKEYWQEFSYESKDFTKELLQKKVKDRASVSEALTHPWFAS